MFVLYCGFLVEQSCSMQWTSSEQIVSELRLSPNGDSSEEILACVRQEMAAIHPDKSNGTFKSPDDEERWHKLTAAKEYLENESHHALAMIPVSQLTAIIKTVIEASAEPASTRTSRFLNESASSIRRQTFFPKLTSGIFAAVCGFLVSISGILKDNPILGPILAIKQFQLLLVILMLYSAVLFVLFWIREGQKERRVEWLLTTSGIQTTLRRALDQALFDGNFWEFKFRDFLNGSYPNRKMEMMRTGPLGPLVFLIAPGQIDHALAEKTADLMLDRLKEDKIIAELSRRGFERRFTVTNDVATEVRLNDNSLT